MSLQVGNHFWLAADRFEFLAGTEMTVKKVIALRDGPVYLSQQADGSGRSLGFSEKDPKTGEVLISLTPITAAPPVPEAVPAGEEMDGPVLDLFVSFTPSMEDAIAQNFFANYVQQYGPYDTQPLESLMETQNIPVGEQWSESEVAKMSWAFSKGLDLPVDPEAVALLVANGEMPSLPLAPTPLATMADVTSAPVAVEEAPKKRGRPRKEDAPVVPAVIAATPVEKVEVAAAVVQVPTAIPSTKGATQRVDRPTWTAVRVDALRLAGVMLPILSEIPDQLDEVVALAVKMVVRCMETREG